MKKTGLWVILLSGIFSFNVFGQHINSDSVAGKFADTAVSTEDSKFQNAKGLNKTQETSEKELPPTRITPEQKAEIHLEAKKKLHSAIKRQSIRERKDMIDVMTTAEKVKIRRQAMLEGKTEAEISEAEAEIEKPALNPSSNKAMEKYVFEKVGLNNEK